MTHLYLVVLGYGFDREEVVNYLESLPGMGTWFYSMPNSFFIESSRPAWELSDLVKRKYPAPELRHFITRIPREDNQGWMPENHWTIFNGVVR